MNIDWEGWAEYIVALKSYLNLRAWTIELLHDSRPDREDAAAMITPVFGRALAEIRLSEDWKSYPPERQRHYLVHELIHLHMDAIAVASRSVREVLGRPTWEVFEHGISDQIEYATDRLAEAIAPYLPLPPLWDEPAESAAPFGWPV